MDAVTLADLAQLAGVSRAAVTQAVKSGRLVRSADGSISLSDPINSAYLAKHKSATPADSPRKPSSPRPPRRPPPTMPPPPIDDDSSEEPDEGNEEGLGLLAQEKRASIRLKNAQTARHMQALAENMGRLVSREIVVQGFARVGHEIGDRLLGFGKIAAPRVRSMALSGATEAEIRDWLESECAAIARAVSEAIAKEATP